MQYELLFLNAGGPWTRQFSYDEQGLAPMYLFYFLIFLVGIFVHLKSVYDLWKREAYHVVIKLLTACVVLEFFYLMFMLVHYMQYKNNGVGVPGLKGFADFLDICFQLLFILLLILLAKGWAISTSTLTDRIPLLVLMIVFFILYLAMFIWGYTAKNYAVLYIYESVPGIIILVLRVLTLLWFLWCLRKTLISESGETKKRFYIEFGAFFTPWFLILPLVVVIAAGISKGNVAWGQYTAIHTTYVTINTISLAGLCYLFWPTKVSQYFALKSDVLLGSGHNQSPYETL